tara:strand:- start:19 stop:195 length:177 start_codon:yes stop_codon:yes gene_type:complete
MKELLEKITSSTLWTDAEWDIAVKKHMSDNYPDKVPNDINALEVYELIYNNLLKEKGG